MPERFDPLAGVRDCLLPGFDVFACGTVFLDIIFAGLPGSPKPGTEIWAEGMASCPGGIANFGIAARRLGLRTSIAGAFGDDDYAEFCWRTLTEEGVDLSRSKRYGGWHSPVTVSMSFDGDRSMVTHGHPAPEPATAMIGTVPDTRAVLCDLAEHSCFELDGWVRRARTSGALVMADVGWDPAGGWQTEVLANLAHCDVFVPNAVEALAYTRSSTVQSALYALADLVPVAVITDGANGAHAIDSRTGEEASVPALVVDELDPTGAGDVFSAGFLLGTLAGWPLGQRLDLACLCSALALQQYGGSLAAPGWGDVVDWWHALTSEPVDDAYHRSVRRRYGFLAELAPRVDHDARRRASATIARLADVEGLV